VAPTGDHVEGRASRFIPSQDDRCPRCGSDRRIIEALFEGEAARRILRARGESTEVPVRAPARDPLQLDLWSHGPTRSDEFDQHTFHDDSDQREAAA
jgi:hypothetical protein